MTENGGVCTPRFRNLLIAEQLCIAEAHLLIKCSVIGEMVRSNRLIPVLIVPLAVCIALLFPVIQLSQPGRHKV